MRRLLSAAAIALASLLVIGGDAVLSGGASAHTVDVSQAIPVTAAAPSLLADPLPAPDAARLSALSGAAVLATQQNAETAEDAAVNKSDLPAKTEETADDTAEAKAVAETEAKAETETTTVSIQALGVVSGTGVRMRSGAGTDYDILKTLDKGTVVELTAVEGDWYRISYEGQRGFVSAQYITRYDTAGGLNAAGKVTADVLNIRAAAKSGSTSLGTVTNGTVIAVTGIETGGWFAVSYNGVSGYVASQYVLICSPASITSTADKPAGTADAAESTETTETTDSTVSPSASASDIVSVAQQYLGVPYVYGGSSPSGFDCSGFTMYVFAQVGISLPHGATSQLSYGTEVSRSNLQPGDLVFFQDYGAVASHVGIYIGGDQFIHASSSSGNSRCVTTSSLSESYYASHYLTARRH